MFSILHVFVLKSIFNSKYGELKEKAAAEGRGELHSLIFLYIPKVWKPLLALGILQFVTLWNSYYSAMVYINDMSQAPPVLKFNLLLNSGEISYGDPLILQYAALISAPSVILLLVFRRLLTSEVFTSQLRKL
jgi:putative aldouronate transport system permease protein